jgi:RNA polymerase-binding transcription factor DksA
MDQTLLNESKKKLEEEHNVLVEELKSIASRDPNMKGDWDAKMPQFEPSEGGSHASLEEEADEVEEYETRLAAEHSLESRLLEVNKALERIRHGTYGTCAVCKKEIPIERMKANPAAETHVEHN